MSRMVWIGAWILVLGFALPLGGCTTMLRKEAPRTERLLVEAGFRTIPADTPERVAQLQALPPFKIVKRVKDDNVRYVYADPAKCQCVYVGDADQYALYKRYLSQGSIPELDALEEAMVTEDEARAFDAWPLWW